MPSTRTGWWYSARPSMPSSPTLRQGSYVFSPSSTTSTSILRGLSPYRWWEQIPDITLPKYGRIVNDDDDYEDLMAILFPQSDLYSRTITMWHLWITAQKLRREADRQEIKVRRLFMELEGLELQQVLHPHWNIPPRESFSPAAQPPTLYYPAPSQETRSPTPPPPTNITTTRSTRKPDHYWRWQWRIRQTRQQFLYSWISVLHTSLLPPTLSRMYRSMTSILWMSTIHMWSLLPMSAGTPSVWLYKMLKPVTSTIVGDIVTNSFLLTHMQNMLSLTLFYLWSTCVHLKANMSFSYAYLVLLHYVLHVFASRLTHFSTYLNP